MHIYIDLYVGMSILLVVQLIGCVVCFRAGVTDQYRSPTRIQLFWDIAGICLMAILGVSLTSFCLIAMSQHLYLLVVLGPAALLGCWLVYDSWREQKKWQVRFESVVRNQPSLSKELATAVVLAILGPFLAFWYLASAVFWALLQGWRLFTSFVDVWYQTMVADMEADQPSSIIGRVAMIVGCVCYTPVFLIGHTLTWIMQRPLVSKTWSNINKAWTLITLVVPMIRHYTSWTLTSFWSLLFSSTS